MPRHPVSPYWDERFHGYGGDKNSYVNHLRLRGYKFLVLPEGFTVHNPHASSHARKHWDNRRDNELAKKMLDLTISNDRELKEKYNDTGLSVMPKCKEWRWSVSEAGKYVEREKYALPI